MMRDAASDRCDLSGITVNALSPAYVRTALVENQIADQVQTHQIPENEVVEKISLSNPFSEL